MGVILEEDSQIPRSDFGEKEEEMKKKQGKERGTKEKNLVFGNEEKQVGFLEFYLGGKGGDRDHLCVSSTCSFDSLLPLQRMYAS